MGSPTIKDDDIRHTLQQNVRQILATLHLSENMLSHRTGVSQKQLNNITNARTGCGIDALAYVAKEFGVPAWFLLIPGAGAAFEDARRITTITEFAIRGTPEDRLALHRSVRRITE